MSGKNDIRQNLLGCLETALFMRGGPQRFSAQAASMKKSFVVPLLALPLTATIVIAAHPYDDLSGFEAKILITIHCLRVVLSLTLFLSLAYVMLRSMNRMDCFCRFATAHNWLLLPAVIFALPPVISFLTGHHSWDEVYPLLVVITLYSYVCTAFMAAHVMRIPWELAGFVSICGMAIHQESLHFLKWAAINTIYWIT